MNKIYVIHISYEASVIGVFSTLKAAKQAMKKVDKVQPCLDMYIEEYSVDRIEPCWLGEEIAN